MAYDKRVRGGVKIEKKPLEATGLELHQQRGKALAILQHRQLRLALAKGIMDRPGSLGQVWHVASPPPCRSRQRHFVEHASGRLPFLDDHHQRFHHHHAARIAREISGDDLLVRQSDIRGDAIGARRNVRPQGHRTTMVPEGTALGHGLYGHGVHVIGPVRPGPFQYIANLSHLAQIVTTTADMERSIEAEISVIHKTYVDTHQLPSLHDISRAHGAPSPDLCSGHAANTGRSLSIALAGTAASLSSTLARTQGAAHR
ncbi:hypothetical protein D3C77_404170 [compost metagenome]